MLTVKEKFAENVRTFEQSVKKLRDDPKLYTWGANNLALRTGHGWNSKLDTFNTRTLSSEGSLTVLMKELFDIKLDIIALIEVRSIGEGSKMLNSEHILCCRGHTGIKELGVRFLIHKEKAWNVEEFTALARGWWPL